MSVYARLHAVVAAVCPIFGVSVDTPGDPASVRIDFAPAATPQQQANAQAAVNAFDWSPAAQTAWEAQQTQAAAQALLSDPGPTGILIRALGLALNPNLKTSDVVAQMNTAAAPLK